MAESIIVCNPDIMSGVPCFRGTRVPVKMLFDYLEEEGSGRDEFLEDFPTVTRNMAIAALEEAKAAVFSKIA